MNMYLGKILRRQLDKANPKVQNTPVHTHWSTMMVKNRVKAKKRTKEKEWIKDRKNEQKLKQQKTGETGGYI